MKRIKFIVKFFVTVILFVVLFSNQVSSELFPPKKNYSNIGFVGGLLNASYYNPYITKQNLIHPDYKIDENQENNIYAGVVFEYPFGSFQNSTNSLIFRLLYEDKSVNTEEIVSFEEKLVNDPVPPGGLTFLQTNYIYKAQWNLKFLSLDILFKQNLSRAIPLGIATGITVSIPLENNSYETYCIEGENDSLKFTDTLGVKLLDNRRTAVLNDGEIENANPVQIGLHMQLQYEIIFSESFAIIPEIGYTYPLMKVSSEGDWKIHNLYLGASMRFVINNPF